MTDDRKVETKCEICGDVIHYVYREPPGYDSRSYGWTTVKAYENRRFSLPERKYELSVEVCLECQKKDPTLHKLVHKKRIEWYDEEINNKKNQIKHIKKEIKNLENSIPKEKKKLQKLKNKRQGLIDND